MRPLPVALLLTVACSAAQAQTKTPRVAFQDVEISRNRGVTSIRLRGPLPSAVTQQAPLKARLARGAATALSAPVELEDGRGAIQFRTARLLLNGRYTVELTSGGAVVCTALIQIGDDPEVVAARERLIRWYRTAGATLRELSATLERRGRFHLALLTAKRPAHERSFQRDFLPDWTRALRVASMDLATYRRRLLLPYRPRLGVALRALLPSLQARRDVWRTAIVGDTKRGVDPGPNTRVEAGASLVLNLLGRPKSDLADWRAGPLGTPPEVPKPGTTYTDPLGFSIAIPAQATVDAPRDPVDRLRFKIDGAIAIVRVLERPDDRTPKELRESVELGAWERWDSYKRLSGKALATGQGLRLEYTAHLETRDQTGGSGGATARVIQLSRFPKAGRRTISLILLRPEGVPLPKPLKALEATW